MNRISLKRVSEIDADLKPCPFCGAKARILMGKKIKHKAPRGYRRFYSIGCTNRECILKLDERGGRLIFTVSPGGFDTMVRRWNCRRNELVIEKVERETERMGK